MACTPATGSRSGSRPAPRGDRAQPAPGCCRSKRPTAPTTPGWACNELGTHYAQGRIVNGDPERALAYFSRACELRFQAGCVNLLDARHDQRGAASRVRSAVAAPAGGTQPDRHAGAGALRASLHTRLDVRVRQARRSVRFKVQGSRFKVRASGSGCAFPVHASVIFSRLRASAGDFSCFRVFVAGSLSWFRVFVAPGSSSCFVSSWPSPSCLLLRVLQRAERTRGGAGGLRRSARGADHDGHRSRGSRSPTRTSGGLRRAAPAASRSRHSSSASTK